MIIGLSGNNFDLFYLDVVDVNGDGYFDLLLVIIVDYIVVWYDNVCIGIFDCLFFDVFIIMIF